MEWKIKLSEKELNKIIFVCKNYDTRSKEVVELFDKKIILLNEKETYSQILKPLSFKCPIKEIKKETKKEKLQGMLAVMFSKNRTKGYFLSAIVLLLGSLIMRYNMYYIISASILCLLALYSHFNTRFNQTVKEKIL